jgi:hypothetical protein
MALIWLQAILTQQARFILFGRLYKENLLFGIDPCGSISMFEKNFLFKENTFFLTMSRSYVKNIMKFIDKNTATLN